MDTCRAAGLNVTVTNPQYSINALWVNHNTTLSNQLRKSNLLIRDGYTRRMTDVAFQPPYYPCLPSLLSISDLLHNPRVDATYLSPSRITLTAYQFLPASRRLQRSSSTKPRAKLPVRPAVALSLANLTKEPRSHATDPFLPTLTKWHRPALLLRDQPITKARYFWPAALF
jgi:hypothetical protein